MRVEGIIVRRRSMGRSLAFADIRIIGGYNDGTNSDNVDNNGQKNNNNDDDVIIRVAFRRMSPSWDISKDDTFPTKKSSLPFGAKVMLELRECCAASANNTVAAKDEKVEQRVGATGTSTGRNDKEPLEVHSWHLLSYPSEIATKAASIRPTQNSISSDNRNGKKTKNDDSDGNSHNGISCTEYLKARGEMFLSVNSHPSYCHLHSNTKKTNESRNVASPSSADGMVIRSGNSNEGYCLATREGGDGSDNCHGDKKAKTQRAKTFASWLIERFGVESLKQPCNPSSNPEDHHGGGGVLDIAGGKGQLSVELATMAQIQCTIIDPLIRGQRCGSSRLLPKKEIKRIDKVNGPHPFHVAKWFDGNEFLELPRQQQHNKEASGSDNGDKRYRSLVERSTCLVGLHPDECTEDILDVALRFNKPVAIVPCCVFPSLFPTRKLRSSGKKVRTYDEFLQYLLEKDDRLRKETLPFAGKNQVIYTTSVE